MALKAVRSLRRTIAVNLTPRYLMREFIKNFLISVEEVKLCVIKSTEMYEDGKRRFLRACAHRLVQMWNYV